MMAAGHDGVHRALADDQVSGGAGPEFGPERAIAAGARSFRMTTGSCSVAISRSRPHNTGTREHQSRTPGA